MTQSSTDDNQAQTPPPKKPWRLFTTHPAKSRATLALAAIIVFFIARFFVGSSTWRRHLSWLLTGSPWTLHESHFRLIMAAATLAAFILSLLAIYQNNFSRKPLNNLILGLLMAAIAIFSGMIIALICLLMLAGGMGPAN